MGISLPLLDSPRPAAAPKPAWLKVRAPGGPNYIRLKGLMRQWNLHSVCEEAACRVELLIPDFQGQAGALQTVIDAGPDILNHNTETVPRLYKLARHGGRYERTLDLFRRARRSAPGLLTKSGIILGLGEEREELVETMGDLREADVNILTLGQYLRPSAQHLPVARYYTPEEFAELGEAGRAMGFAHVESGPLVRSSYHAKRQVPVQTTEG